GGARGAGLKSAPRAEEERAGAAEEYRRAVPVRHHPAFHQNVGNDDRPGRQRPRAARQRLPLRHGHARLRRPRAIFENLRCRQGHHPGRPRRSLVVGEAGMNVQAIAKAGRIPTAAVTGLIVDAMMKSGVPAGDAAKIAELMTEADLTGADAHGVFRLPQYVRRLRAGGVNPRPAITVSKTAPATAMVDGDNGMGHLVMAQAAATAVELARACGVAWVGARRSNHAGAAGVYAAMLLPHDMVGIYSVVASANHMAVWGGAETLIGTNPLAVA